MPKPTSIPIWKIDEMSVHHFGQTQQHPFSSASEHLFHINKLEDYIDKLHFPLPPHRKPVYDFLFLTRGTTRRSKALNTYEIGTDTFFFLPAHQITNHDFMSADTEGYFCHFDFDIFTKHLPELNILRDFPFLQFIGDPIVQVDAALRPFILNLFQRLEAAYQQEKIENFNIIAVYLFTLFSEIKQFYNPSVSTKRSSALTITQNYKDALSNHIYEKQKVTEYANMLSVSPNHLNKSVKSATGQSAQDLLNEMVLLESKILLRQTDLSINEIAFKISQQDASDFSRFFKSKTGITPKQYKQNP
jgi:AraC family transcriptional regulator, transcriptional activator of pobA